VLCRSMAQEYGQTVLTMTNDGAHAFVQQMRARLVSVQDELVGLKVWPT